MNPGDKYKMTDYQINDYSWQMNLTIRISNVSDFGSYVCSATNALGTAQGVVRLQGINSENFFLTLVTWVYYNKSCLFYLKKMTELHLSAKTTPGSLLRNSSVNTPKKVPKERKKMNEPGRGYEVKNNTTKGEQEFGLVHQVNNNGKKNGKKKVHKSDGPMTNPTVSPGWILNVANSQCCFVSQVFLSLVIVISEL